MNQKIITKSFVPRNQNRIQRGIQISLFFTIYELNFKSNFDLFLRFGIVTHRKIRYIKYVENLSIY